MLYVNGFGCLIQDFLGKSDPYLEFAKENLDGTFSVVYRTQVIMAKKCSVTVFQMYVSFVYLIFKGYEEHTEPRVASVSN